MRVVPVLFSQGINEMQSIANAATHFSHEASSRLREQHEVNIASLQALRGYADRHAAWHREQRVLRAIVPPASAASKGRFRRLPGARLADQLLSQPRA